MHTQICDVFIVICIAFILIVPYATGQLSLEEDQQQQQLNNLSHTLYKIEGKVFPPAELQQTAGKSNSNHFNNNNNNWQAIARIHVNGGESVGFIGRDGSFIVQGVPSGSHLVECLHPTYQFEAVRVEITSKGKTRARKVNYIQTGVVIQVPYPLRMKPMGKTRYFQQREQWMITDFLFNPMVLMMVLPLVLLMIVPKVLNDPETKKDMEQMQNLAKFDLPEVSDMVTNFLAGSSTSKSSNTTSSSNNNDGGSGTQMVTQNSMAGGTTASANSNDSSNSKKSARTKKRQ